MTTTKPIIEAAFGRKPSRTPLWFLRQAGRYLPEYREIRAKMSFVELCQNPKLAAEVTVQPLRRYDMDGAIIFSDILILCTALGQELTFGKGHGPMLNPPIRSQKDVAGLDTSAIGERLQYVGDAITETKKQLKPEQTMIGFAGAPFTVASYMIEGGTTKDYTQVKTLRYTDPEAFGQLLTIIADTTVDYLAMQVDAGAECLMLFDTWANQLTPEDYRTLVFPVTQTIPERIKAKYPHIPMIYYPGQASTQLFQQQGSKYDVLAIDWRMPLSRAISVIKELGLDVSVQGNLDPQLMMASPELLSAGIDTVLRDGAAARGHIFNVGHGLMPHLKPENIGQTVELIRSKEQ